MHFEQFEEVLKFSRLSDTVFAKHGFNKKKKKNVSNTTAIIMYGMHFKDVYSYPMKFLRKFNRKIVNKIIIIIKSSQLPCKSF